MFGARRNPKELADEDLMVLVRDGDTRAFEVLFDRHSGPAFSLAYRMCGSRARAEDTVQEAFLSLWRAGGRYDPAKGSVRSWILSAVHNRAIDMFRREAVRPTRPLDEGGVTDRLAAPELTDVEAERRADADHVRGALRELPDDQRQVIELSYYGGFSHLEIAEMLSLPPGTVKGRMRLGMGKMRIALGEAGVLP